MHFSYKCDLKSCSLATYIRVAMLYTNRSVPFSSSKKFMRSSGASGINCSRCWYMDAIANTAFFLTYACLSMMSLALHLKSQHVYLCSRHCRAGCKSGSTSSASLNLHRKRSVFPMIYSFGCCRSKRIPLLPSISPCSSAPPYSLTYQTNIHSCLSFP